ncbi:MAG: PhoH family protein [Peptoniphilus sp.]|nr:PhoH family protein [Peptoniphilus sp.]MDD7362744.1 PhoH family protein [Bacillota bacterium]MDY6044562.1 PhoH family protein [Peptoniphilus sp.]
MQENLDIGINEPRVLKELFGNLDENIQLVEQAFDVTISQNDEGVRVQGDDEAMRKAQIVITNLVEAIRKQKRIDRRDIRYSIDLVNAGVEDSFSALLDDVIVYTEMGRPLRPKTLGQKRYLDAIREYDVVFGIGPAGTGKTYIAMANAVKAFKEKEVNRIILTRPAVEAGESLGFLPGDLQMKVDPYLRPLYDALFEILGQDAFQKYLEKGLIEVAPLAYMRGRTLDNAYVILDEAQNTTNEQMKMFLTRLGYGSKAIITGDITQIDLPRGKQSGLKTVLKILEGVKGIKTVRLGRNDIVRHPLVQRIIEAYDKYDRALEKEREEKKKEREAREDKSNKDGSDHGND